MTNHSLRTLYHQDVICTALGCRADVDERYLPAFLCQEHAEEVFRIVNANRDYVRQAQIDALDAHLAKVEPIPKKYVVYYIQFPHGIKIGVTTNLKSRLEAFHLPQSSVLATEPGGYDLERSRHEFFKDSRIGNTEVFKDSPKIRKHIEAVRKYHGAPIFKPNVGAPAKPRSPQNRKPRSLAREN